jgi:hypothetical protein
VVKVKFVVRFFNVSTKQTERHILEKQKTVGQALRLAVALTAGKDTQDLVIVQEDEE